MAVPEVVWVDDGGLEVVWLGGGEVYWAGGTLPYVPTNFPPPSPTTLQKTINSYLYVQYADDGALQAFVDAYNQIVQSYLDAFNQINLPIYTQGNIAGTLLDWVAAGLYGILRPGLPTLGIPAKGPYNSYPYNGAVPYNGYVPPVGQAYYATSDDVFKRIITWGFYKADGHQFSVRWLKRRINRFLNGVDGTDVPNDQTYAISVVFTGPYAATITLANTAISTIFKAAVEAGILELPFQISWTVTLV